MYPYGGSPSWSNSVGFMNPQAPQPQMAAPQGALGAAMSPPAAPLGGQDQNAMIKQMMVKALQQKQQQPGLVQPAVPGQYSLSNPAYG